jgi:multiple sugar transport system permease protein
MDLGVLNTYIPTVIRYIMVMIGIGVLMLLAYRIQRRFGINHEAAAGRTLVLPWVIGFLIFNVFTIGASLYLSFTEYNLFQAPVLHEPSILENYEDLFNLSFATLESADQRSSAVLPPRHDEIIRITLGDGGIVIGAREEGFWRSMRLTVTYAIITVPLGLAGSLCVALLLNQKVRFVGFWRVLYYLPAVLPAVATALLWRWIFSQSGLLNGVLTPFYALIGIPQPNWLTNPDLAPVVFIMISLWGVFGANSVILLAGLKGISKELYEAVDIDGGSHWAKFRNITIPMLSPALFYNLVTSLIGALQAFEIAAFIPTPTEAGTFLNWHIYQEAFNLRHMGLASAMAWIMLVIILALTALVFRSSQAWVFYEGERERA